MSDLIPKVGKVKIGGLGPKAQRLQALREKAQGKGGSKGVAGEKGSAPKVKDSFAGSKKTAFQRKSV